CSSRRRNWRSAPVPACKIYLHFVQLAFSPKPFQGNQMSETHPLAGKTVAPSMLANIPRLVTAYFANQPDPKVAAQRVAFGTSGHRGSALNNAFNEAHILAISQALCLYRKQQSIDGPLYIGIDT